MSNHKRVPSLEVEKIKISPRTPPTSPPITRKLQLTRVTKIKKLGTNGKTEEFTVTYDELTHDGLLGQGQFGIVFKMHHEASNLTFAVKRIGDSDILEEENGKKNSKGVDLDILLKIENSCPYLIKFYGALRAEAHIWILMELMDTSLDRFYTKRLSLFQTGSVLVTMPELFLSKVAYSVLTGLEFMRKLKLMHRDIKPSNVLLNETGEMKLCDFGISGVTMNSMCKTINGTQMYMPPEKIDSKGSGYSSRSDVWSLGISLIEVGVGEHPFKNASGLLGLMNKIVIIDSPKLDSTKFSQEFCQFIDKCLIKNPEKRANCTELLEEPFITKYVNERVELEFLKSVIDRIKEDPIEN